jgi:hypothetical protein
MITIARLRAYQQPTCPLRSYTSTAGAQYLSGTRGNPAPFRVVTSASELREIQAVAQFEIRAFENEQGVLAFLDEEMEGRARAGLPAVRSAVQGLGPAPAQVRPGDPPVELPLAAAAKALAAASTTAPRPTPESYFPAPTMALPVDMPPALTVEPVAPPAAPVAEHRAALPPTLLPSRKGGGRKPSSRG